MNFSTFIRIISTYNRFLQYVTPRFIVGFVLFSITSGNLGFFERIIVFTPFNRLNINENGLFILSGVFAMIAGWFVYNGASDILKALGYRNSDSKIIVNYDGTNTHGSRQSNANLGLRSRKLEVSQSTNSRRIKYKPGDPLFALASGHDRIDSHIGRLQNNAAVNLVAALFIAGFGIAVLGSAFLEIEKYHDINTSQFKIYDFLIIAMVPRLSISIFLQIFAYFFLLMYRSNLQDVRYFENEITNIDIIAAATAISMRNNISSNQKYVVNRLLKVERNRLMGKNQKVINSSDDERIIGKLVDVERSIKGIKSTKIE